MNAAAPTRQKKSERSDLRRCLDIWLLQHAQALIFSLGQYAKYPINNLLTTAVIGISLALPASFYLLLNNVRTVFSGWDDSLQVTLFLNNDVTDEQALSIASELETGNNISSATVIKRADALAEYQTLSGFADALDVLDENPLPVVIIVRPDVEQASESQINTLIETLEAMPTIDNAQYDSQWIKRLLYLLEIVNRVMIILSTMLALAVLLIIGNTIRLAIYNRRPEIEITKLFGGTDGFIQRPLLYSGLWYGVFGSLIAWLLITVSMKMLREPVKQMANLSASDFELIGLGSGNSLMMLGIGILLGLLGSWISVRRHLRAIEPV